MVKINLNGIDIEAKEGQTILEVAEEHGYKIPTLCHDEELKPYGSCWVCAVKVEGRKGFVTSCGTKINDGMVIDTEGESVKQARKMALELLVSDHYADCQAPCKTACPADIDVQSYVSLIANKQYHEAVRVIKDKLPMPLSIGRVCPAFCEEECRRQLVEDSIAIRQLKRFAADYDAQDYWNYVPEREENKNKSVAIIGGGPSGLSCGYYLTAKGYNVKVFEEMPQAGGWLRYGIPEYRLPKEILDLEIEIMCANGMDIQYNTKIGRDIAFKNIVDDYDAVYLAIGASDAVSMAVPGNDLEGCYLGVDFLKANALGNAPDLGKKVAVIGGGNTAIDCVRTAVRLGTEATIVYRRAEAQMPAEDFEIEAAKKEGVKFKLLTNPVEYIGENGKLSKIKLEKMELGEADSSGRRRPQATGEYEIEEFDSVIAAISQKPNIDFLLEESSKIEGEELPLTRWNTLETPQETMYSGLGNVFAGGDFRRGPATAVEAIGDAKKASQAIDKFLQGEKLDKPKYRFNSVKANKISDIRKDLYAEYDKVERAKMPEIDVEQARSSFAEVETGFTEEQAINEAKRCLECGCQVNETCALRIYASEYNVSQDLFFGDVNQHPIDDSHPFILRDANKCVNCGRCVRTCAEIQGAGVLGYIYRGFETLVAPEFGESLTNTSCESCGKCIAVCPTGALIPKNINYKLNPLENNKVIQSCGMCGSGCDILVDVQSDKVTTISTPAEWDEVFLPQEYDNKKSFNGRNLCYKGRFGWQKLSINDDSPKLFNGEAWDDIDYLQVKQILADKILGGFCVVPSPNLTIEELLIAEELGKYKNSAIKPLIELDDFTSEMLKADFSVVTKERFEKAENYVIIGEISHTLRTLVRLEQLKGKGLILIDYPESDFSKFADKAFTSIDDLDWSDLTNTVILFDMARKDIDKIYSKCLEISDFTESSFLYPNSKYNNIRAYNYFYTSSEDTSNDKPVIFFGDIPVDFKKNSFTVLISDVFDTSLDIDLFIPKASYLDIDGIALADDMRTKVFSKATNKMLHEQLVVSFAEIGIIPISMAEITNWNNRADKFLENLSLENKKIDIDKSKFLSKYKEDIVRFDLFK